MILTGFFDRLFGRKKQRDPFVIEKGLLVKYHEDDCAAVCVPDGVTEIGGCAFEGCRKITSVTLPHGLKKIGLRAFLGCYSLAEIAVPEGVAEIGDYAFCSCESLERVALPQSLETLGSSAFRSCTALSSVELPSKIEHIGEYTFFMCKALTALALPDSLKRLGRQAFSGCSFSEIAVPGGVKSIPAECFENCVMLKNVSLPDTLEKIGEHSFFQCYRLKEIKIPDGVVKIGSQAFGYCDRAETLYLPESAVDIAEDAFSGCTALSHFYLGGVYVHCDVKSTRTEVQTWQIIEMMKIVRSGSLAAWTNVETADGFRTEVKRCGISTEKMSQIALGLYRKNGDPASLNYILETVGLLSVILILEKRFDDMETLLSANPPPQAVEGMTALAIEKGAHEMYVMIQKYKEQNGGYDLPGDRFEL